MTVRSDAEWRALLTEEQYGITLLGGTEPAFTGAYHANKAPGKYSCICCGEGLFDSESKFDSGTGWPSFWQPLAEDRVAEEVDNSHGMVRTEALCSQCDAHLGHVFTDGPKDQGGLRYCINSASLRFIPKEEMEQEGYGYLVKALR